MQTMTNFPLYDGCLTGFSNMDEVRSDCRKVGIDGLEVIWGDEGYHGELPARDLAIGYHLMFWADWVDFWLGDQAALIAKFGDERTVEECYHGTDRSCLVKQYRADCERAAELGARYVVFHVSDISLEECFTYKWLHSDETVIDASVECLNEALGDVEWPFTLLVENQWWPGFTFTDPDKTRRLLDGIHFADKGIMLDTGHLLNTNTDLATQQQAVAYIERMLDEHEDLMNSIRGVHLHQSLTGEYVKTHTGTVPDFLREGTYWERFGRCYGHILQIDTHQPWTDPAIARIIERIAPEFLNNELSAAGRVAHREAVRTQMETLRRGGLDV